LSTGVHDEYAQMEQEVKAVFFIALSFDFGRGIPLSKYQ
jgi:hypothetical protein